MEKLIMKFILNGNLYTIYTTDMINDDNDIMGYTIFTTNTVYIKNMRSETQMLRALKHELTHAWLWEYGHNQHDENKTFNFEDVCEIVACSNTWINEIVEKYKNAQKEKHEDDLESNYKV